MVSYASLDAANEVYYDKANEYVGNTTLAITVLR